MPTYVYQCDDCGHDFEAVQKFADEPLTVCPECEGRVRRVLQPSPVIFKGSGWYITDSRNKSGGKGAAKTEKAESAAKADAGANEAKGKTDKTDKSAKESKADNAKAPAAASAD